MIINQAKRMAIKAIEDYPSLKNDIVEAWELMMSEIADGESKENEAEIFMGWLNNELEEMEER